MFGHVAANLPQGTETETLFVRGLQVRPCTDVYELPLAACNTIYPFSMWFRRTSGVFRSLREILGRSGFRDAEPSARADAASTGS